MRQLKQHKSLIINTLEILDETFETNETVFHSFYALSLFFQILKTVFRVSFCLILVSFRLISSHFVSSEKQRFPKSQELIQQTKNKMEHKTRHKLLFNNTLYNFGGIFETNETLFLAFLIIHLFFQILNPNSYVPFCSISVSFSPILFHFVSFSLSLIVKRFYLQNISILRNIIHNIDK